MEPVKVSVTLVIGVITEMNSVTPSKYQDRHPDRKKGGWQNKLVQRCVRVGPPYFSLVYRECQDVPGTIVRRNL